MRASELIAIRSIASLPGRRDVNNNAASALAESIKSIGLKTPITVRLVDGFVDFDGVVVDGQPVLVTGAHRLEAARLLGWDKIECYVFEGDNVLDAELWEIDENLCRHNLTPTEEAEHISRRKELWEARREQEANNSGSTCATIPDRGPGMPEGFATATEKATGKSKASTNRAVKRAHDVCQEARDLIRNTKLDTGAMLDKLAKIDPADQVSYVNQQVEAMQQNERENALREDRRLREKEAKELRKKSLDECLNFLCTMMNDRDWAKFIDLVERAGGSISSNRLRNWQSP